MTTIIAHRGARSIAPENTIFAARKAWQSGADLWETDVAVTKDEHLILFHDDSLDRTTDAGEKFSKDKTLIFTDYTLEQIRTLDTGARYMETDPFGEIERGTLQKKDLAAFKGEKVPTLEEALLYTKEKGWKINLELKPLPGRFKDFPVPERVMRLVHEIGLAPEQVIISSFRHEWLDRVEKLSPDTQIQALIGYYKTVPLDWGDFSFETYNARSTLIDEKQIRTAQKKGKKINLFTVNRSDEMRNFMGLGVDGLITDYPQLLKKVIKTS